LKTHKNRERIEIANYTGDILRNQQFYGTNEAGK